MSDSSHEKTILFPKEEKVGFKQNNKVIIFSAKSFQIEKNINFPFQIKFFSPPFDDKYMLVVNEKQPESLILWNFESNSIEATVRLETEIINFKFADHFSCAITEFNIVVFHSHPLIIHQTIQVNIPADAFDIIQDINDNNHCIIAYADGQQYKSATIQRIPSITAPVTFDAHKSSIRMLALAGNGKCLATVSNKGTIIRIWSLDGKMIHESRRGLTPADIIHMSFSPCSKFLCVSSNHFTTHIFNLCEDIKNHGMNKSKSVPNSSSGWLTLLPKADITISIPDAKYYSAFIIQEGKTLFSISDKGTCDIYDIDKNCSKCSFQSRVIIPKLASLATMK